MNKGLSFALKHPNSRLGGATRRVFRLRMARLSWAGVARRAVARLEVHEAERTGQPGLRFVGA